MDKITEKHLAVAMEFQATLVEVEGHISITAETAQGFAEWCSTNGWEYLLHRRVWINEKGEYQCEKTTSELYAMYLEQLNQEG